MKVKFALIEVIIQRISEKWLFHQNRLMIHLIPWQTIYHVEFTMNLTNIQYLYAYYLLIASRLVSFFTLLHIKILNLKLSETPRNLQILQIKICNRNRLWHNYSSREAQELFQNFEILKPVWQNKTAAYYTTIKFNNLRYFRFFSTAKIWYFVLPY